MYVFIMYVCMYVRMLVRTHVCMSARTRVCMYVCMYVCIYVCKGWARIHRALALLITGPNVVMRYMQPPLKPYRWLSRFSDAPPVRVDLRFPREEHIQSPGRLSGQPSLLPSRLEECFLGGKAAGA
jgi:hypothetical protein